AAYEALRSGLSPASASWLNRLVVLGIFLVVFRRQFRFTRFAFTRFGHIGLGRGRRGNGTQDLSLRERRRDDGVSVVTQKFGHKNQRPRDVRQVLGGKDVGRDFRLGGF